MGAGIIAVAELGLFLSCAASSTTANGCLHFYPIPTLPLAVNLVCPWNSHEGTSSSVAMMYHVFSLILITLKYFYLYLAGSMASWSFSEKRKRMGFLGLVLQSLFQIFINFPQASTQGNVLKYIQIFVWWKEEDDCKKNYILVKVI